MIRVLSMEMMRWWYNNLFLFLFLTCLMSLETSMKMDIKNCECYCQNCSEQFSIVYTLIHHGNGVKMFQTLQWNHLPMALGSFCVLAILILFLWSTRVQTMENCCWFVNNIQCNIILCFLDCWWLCYQWWGCISIWSENCL